MQQPPSASSGGHAPSSRTEELQARVREFAAEATDLKLRHGCKSSHVFALHKEATGLSGQTHELHAGVGALAKQ